MRELTEVLAYLYPDHASIRRVTSYAGMDTGHTDMEGAALDVWSAILETEAKQGRRGRIWAEAIREFPDNPSLIPAGVAYLNQSDLWQDERQDFSRNQRMIMVFASLIVVWLLILSVAAVVW